MKILDYNFDRSINGTIEDKLYPFMIPIYDYFLNYKIFLK